MTLEMVYAIHSFQAKRDDELDFEYGEPIIVLEKDDMYGDGWWKVINRYKINQLLFYRLCISNIYIFH
jgi:hypothetical protein